jgi:hypothetical protein
MRLGARQKLNRIHFLGSLVLAVVGGWAFQSWAVFALALLLSVALDLAAGDFRPTRRQSSRRVR